MSGSRHAFKLNDATRLIKSVIAAGFPREQLRVVHDILGHKISVEWRDGDTPGDQGNDLDKWVASRADESKRS
jgi:hypothetical protein